MIMKKNMSLFAALFCCSCQVFAEVTGDSARIKYECKYEKFQKLAEQEFKNSASAGINNKRTIKVKRKKYSVSLFSRKKIHSTKIKRSHDSRVSKCFKL
jgi:hypothetical protein